MIIAEQERKAKFVIAPPEEVIEGMLVLAHMKSFSPWPARVIKKIVTKTQTNIRVYFYGDQTTGTVKVEQIGLIGENSALIKCLSQKKIKNYAKAVLEMERLTNVPPNLSIFDANRL